MSKGHLSPPDSLLALALGRSRLPAGDHPELQEVAAFLDRALPGSRRRAVEAHLASCASCRELAIEAGLGRREALDAAPRRGWATPVALPRLRYALMAVATFAAVGLGISFLLPRPETPLRVLGVTVEDLQAASPELAELAVAGARGEWPPLTGFDAFVGDDRRPALRGPSHPEAPVPLTPRWSVVRETRPRLSWYPPSFPATHYEVLLVDEAERPIGHHQWEPVASPEVGSPTTFPYPDAFPSLQPGRAYAWKVNAGLAGEWTASAFVPFRTSSPEEDQAVEQVLSATDSPFVQVAELVFRGLHEEAMERVIGLPEGDARERVLRSILERKGLPPAVVERELERRGERLR